MNPSTVDAIVRAVLAELSRREPGATGGAVPVARGGPAGPQAGEEPLPDLTEREARQRVGVVAPERPEVLRDLVEATPARVAVGRAGTRPRTEAMIRFLADHSRSKDTVLKDFPDSWVEKSGFLELRTEIIEKDQFLTRPDLGRRLSRESIGLLQAKCQRSPQVQVIVSDGLSTDAVVVNFDEIIPPLLKGLESNGMKVGTPVFVRHGRVKVEDHIGELLDAQVVILLIGERPGLGQSESLSCYMVFRPRVDTTVESDRICISNIHAGGTPPVEAAAVIVEFAQKFLREGRSGAGVRP